MDSYNSWAWKINNLEYNEYELAFTSLYKITNNTKLRNFQYRLLLNHIPVNDMLYKWKIENSECNSCLCWLHM